jgi:hypothetical protein
LASFRRAVASISDRGDEYFEHFAERHNALLAELPVQSVQQPVLVQPAGSISPTRRWLRTALRAYAPTVSFWAPP